MVSLYTEHPWICLALHAVDCLVATQMGLRNFLGFGPTTFINQIVDRSITEVTQNLFINFIGSGFGIEIVP